MNFFSSPFMRQSTRTDYIMWRVMLALLPGMALTISFKGSGRLLQWLVALAVAVSCETIIALLRHRSPRRTLSDGSVVLTATLLTLCMPNMAPLWLVSFGAFFAVVFGKGIYGGLGMNPFNPAMVGYVMLLICFPWGMTQFSPEVVSWQDLWQEIDMRTGATLLDYSRQVRVEQHNLDLLDITRSSSLCLSLAWLLGAAFLLYKRDADWRIITAVLLGIALTASAFYFYRPDYYLAPWDHIIFGASVFGACFIATDPVTAATSRRGRWIYGLLIGFLTVLIRNIGNYPDGFAFSVLLANACVPLIDYYSRPRYSARIFKVEKP